MKKIVLVLLATVFFNGSVVCLGWAITLTELTAYAEATCSGASKKGETEEIKVRGDGGADVKWFKGAQAGLHGTFELSKEQWDGLKQVQAEHRKDEYKDQRKCKMDVLKTLSSLIK